MKNRM